MTMFLRLGCALLSCLVASASVCAANLTPVDAGGGALSPPVAHDGYLYVGTGATLSVWNMADPANPAYVGRSGSAPAEGPIRALTMVGDYLYAAWNTPSDTGGLIVYSLTDPAHRPSSRRSTTTSSRTTSARPASRRAATTSMSATPTTASSCSTRPIR